MKTISSESEESKITVSFALAAFQTSLMSCAITTFSSLICCSHWVMKLRNVGLILCVKEVIVEAFHGMSWIGLLTYSISMASILQVSGSSQVTRQRRSSPMGHHLYS